MSFSWAGRYVHNTGLALSFKRWGFNCRSSNFVALIFQARFNGNPFANFPNLRRFPENPPLFNILHGFVKMGLNRIKGHATALWRLYSPDSNEPWPWFETASFLFAQRMTFLLYFLRRPVFGRSQFQELESDRSFVYARWDSIENTTLMIASKRLVSGRKSRHGKLQGVFKACNEDIGGFFLVFNLVCINTRIFFRVYELPPPEKLPYPLMSYLHSCAYPPIDLFPFWWIPLRLELHFSNP